MQGCFAPLQPQRTVQFWFFLFSISFFSFFYSQFVGAKPSLFLHFLKSFVVLDFFLAQNTPSIALWACRRRFFTPRGIARSAAPLVDETKLSLTREGPLQRKIHFAKESICKGASHFCACWVASSSKAPHGLRFFYRLGHPPSFYSGVFPTAVINYFALYSEAGSLPRLKLRTAYAFLLTIRRSQRRIRSLLYKNAGWGETRLLYNGLPRVKYIDFIPECGLIFGCLLALKSNYIFFLHVCFAIIDQCKGAKAPLQPCGTVQLFI